MIGRCFLEFRRIDPESFQQSVGLHAIGRWAVDQKRAAVAELQFSSEVELVAFGVAAEVVVIFQDQNVR